MRGKMSLQSWHQAIHEVLKSKGAVNIQVIPVGNGIVDDFIIASGTSSRHVRALAQEIQKLYKNHSTVRIQGDHEESQWVVLDLFGTFVHIFGPETRRVYDLEGLWGQESKVEPEALCVPQGLER